MPPDQTRLGKLVNRALHRQANRAMHVVATVGYRFPRGNPARYNVELIADLPYLDTGKWANLLDVYRPRGPSPSGGHPVVFYVHGGGFSMLSKETHRIMALAFASRGYLVVNINYRLGQRYLYPTPLEDAAAALLWARDNAARLGGDFTRLALAGESAGANLVAALTLCLSVPRPEPAARLLLGSGIKPSAAMPIYGLLDLTDIERFWRRRPLKGHIWRQLEHAALSYVGDPVSLRAVAAPLASPLRLLEELPPEQASALPPFFIPCGTRDPLLDDSRRLAAALERLGVERELLVHPGEIHGYNAMLWRPAARDMWQRAHAFLEQHLPPPRLDLAKGALSG
jgi:acetyl esterase